MNTLRIRLLYLITISLIGTVYGQPSQMDLERLVDAHYPDSSTPGAILMLSQKDQQIHASTGVGNLSTPAPLNSQTNFRMASISKHYTAWAVAHCLDNIGLSFNEAIARFFPELGPRAQDITIGHLISHSSGIPDYEPRIPDGQEKQLSDADVLSLVSPLDTLYFEPGEDFRYSNTAYCLMTVLIERLTGTSYEDYLATNLFGPLELGDTKVLHMGDSIAHRAYGYHLEEKEFVFADQSVTSATKGDGGVYTSAADFHRFSEYYNEFMRSHLYTSSGRQTVIEGVDYTMGLFRARTQRGEYAYFHSGETTGFRHVFLRIPQQDLVISLFTNRDDLMIADLFDKVMVLMDIEIPALHKQPLFAWLSSVYADQLVDRQTN